MALVIKRGTRPTERALIIMARIVLVIIVKIIIIEGIIIIERIIIIKRILVVLEYKKGNKDKYYRLY